MVDSHQMLVHSDRLLLDFLLLCLLVHQLHQTGLRIRVHLVAFAQKVSALGFGRVSLSAKLDEGVLALKLEQVGFGGFFSDWLAFEQGHLLLLSLQFREFGGEIGEQGGLLFGLLEEEIGRADVARGLSRLRGLEGKHYLIRDFIIASISLKD